MDITKVPTDQLKAMLAKMDAVDAAPPTDITQVPTSELQAMLETQAANGRVARGFAAVDQAAPTSPELQEETEGRAQSGDPRFNSNLLDAGATGIAQGLTFGTSDEIQAALQSGFGLLSDFDETHENVSAEMEAARRKYPWLFLGGELAGGVTNAAGLIKSGLSASARFAGSKIGTRIGAAAGDGALAGAAFGAGSGDGLQDRWDRAQTGFAVGGLTGPIVEAAGNQVAKIFSKKVPGPGSEAVAKADEFGIPLTRGQATGDVKQQAFEQAALNEAKGEKAGKIIRDFAERQRQAITHAGEDLGDEFGGGDKLIEAVDDAGRIVRDSVSDLAATLKDDGNQAYNAVGRRDATIAASAVRDLPNQVKGALGVTDDILDPSIAPVATRAQKLISDFAAKADGDAVGVSIHGMERLRQGLNRLKAAPGTTDAMAMKEIKKGFDTWLDDTVDNALFSGDPRVLADLKDARGIWTQYLGIVRPKAKDDAGRVIEKFATQDVDAVEAVNWMIGSANFGASGRPVRVVKRVKELFGPDSDQINSLRQAAWLRITQAPRGGNAPGAAEVANRVNDFVLRKGKPLANELFAPKERTQMLRYVSALRQTIPKPEATNPSKSGFAASRLLASVGDNISALLGYSAGGVDAGIATRLALPIFRNTRHASQARTAITKPTLPARTTGGGLVGGGLAGGSEKQFGMAPSRSATGPLEITIRPSDIPKRATR